MATRKYPKRKSKSRNKLKENNQILSRLRNKLRRHRAKTKKQSKVSMPVRIIHMQLPVKLQFKKDRINLILQERV